jgi:hypothetical protein
MLRMLVDRHAGKLNSSNLTPTDRTDKPFLLTGGSKKWKIPADAAGARAAAPDPRLP